MRTIAALAAVVVLGALLLWWSLPGNLLVVGPAATEARTTGADPVAGPSAQPAGTDSATQQAPDDTGRSGSFADRARSPEGAQVAGAQAPASIPVAPPLQPVRPEPVAPALPPPRVPLAPAGADGRPPADPATPTIAADLDALDLRIPVQGIEPGQLLDTFTDARGQGRSHDAIDIMAPSGTPVLAVADGRIAKLFTSEYGGLTVYQFDASGALAYYYAHLDGYADGIAEGDAVSQGELLGYVGFTGNAHPDAPHLHFAIFVLGPERNWWQGTPVNPYPYLAGRP